MVADVIVETPDTATLVFFTGNVTHTETPGGQILFVLLKGRRDSSGSYLVTQIVYGDSQQAAIVAAR